MLKLKSKYEITKALQTAFNSPSMKKIQNASVKKLIGSALFAKIENKEPILRVGSKLAIFSMHETDSILFKHTEINLMPDESHDFNANTIIAALNYFIEETLAEQKPVIDHVSANDALDNLTIKDYKTPKVAAHDLIESDVAGLDSVLLPHANTFYQSVKSTGASSRYAYIGKDKQTKAKISMRILGGKISVRIEPLTPLAKVRAHELGLNDNSSYASAHFEASGVVLNRFVKMMTAILDGWDLAPFDEAKIKEVSQ